MRRERKGVWGGGERGEGRYIYGWRMIQLSSISTCFPSTVIYYTLFVNLDCVGTLLPNTSASRSFRVCIEMFYKRCGDGMLSLKGVGEEIKIECSAEGLIFTNMARKEKDETRRRAWVLVYNHWT
jgi:hypothetical protein